MRHPLDKCFECGAEIPLRPGYVPMCQPCANAYVAEIREREARRRELSRMGAIPGPKTKRAARLRAIQSLRLPPANDNGTPFGRDHMPRKKKSPHRR